MRVFAIIQEDPCPVFVADAHVDVGRFELQLPGADNELVLAYYGDGRHVRIQEGRASSSRRLDCITT